ncbi:tRNA glutamyl-Q(34) synthetase GluQRS [Neptuniibacter marinus]|mgnify:CR=1 FL=1|uniref:tRNA glutamyl-Q(34) synthetase GluQRS n=1 Tax=Neptuniibacter marinus TaxID=1806670 RepID=UPI000834025D|nr:tRNA glutamyl-Q(34) synthetase GluQRS [Neptuniibacter marinus]
MTYIGRFAPSPTGPLHFGSLIAAFASFLDARANDGKWLLRIEDLDPPREQTGAKEQFPKILDAFGLYWDEEISFQSQRHNYYQDVLDTLLSEHYAYRCDCSRKEILARSNSTVYDRHCLLNPPNSDAQCAIRIKCKNISISFNDQIQGPYLSSLSQSGDFVVYRRDNLYAYLLAVVVDDYLQGVTHVVRGSDLLNETPRQIHLQQLLDYPTPAYAHIPVASNTQGQKLSKQTFAPALKLDNLVPSLFNVLVFLDQQPPSELLDASRDEIIRWGIENWDLEKISQTLAKPVDRSE